MSVRRMEISPSVFLMLNIGVLVEVVGDAVPPRAKIVGSGVTDLGNWWADIESPEFTGAEPLKVLLRTHHCQPPAGLSEALNSGDGTYRP